MFARLVGIGMDLSERQLSQPSGRDDCERIDVRAGRGGGTHGVVEAQASSARDGHRAITSTSCSATRW